MVIDTNNSINTNGPRGRSSGVASTSGDKTPVAESSAKPANSKENVVLSQEARELNHLQAKISSMPDVDMARVAAIKQAIAEGKFEINAERIAENMLNQDELLG